MISSSNQKPIAFVKSTWHRSIIDSCQMGFLDAMEKHRVNRNQIKIFEVPGALEIPLRAKILAKSGTYSLLVAAAFVVDGGIYRHEFVAGAVVSALLNVQLETEVPILSAVLTPHQFHDHEEHHNFFAYHMSKKGQEVAEASIRMLQNQNM